MPTTTCSVSSSKPPHSSYSWPMLIGANVLWAVSYVAAKIVLRDTSVIIMLTLRMGISAVILFPLLFAKRKQLKREDLFPLALFSLQGFVLTKILEYSGLALTTASDVALLMAGESLFTAALAWILLRERFKKLTGFAFLLGLLGVYLVIERSLIPNFSPGGGTIQRTLGDLLVMLSLLIEAFYTIRGKAMLVKHSPLVITAAPIVGSALFWVPMGGWEILAKGGWHPISLLGWASIGWLAVMSTVVAYLAWFQGLTKIDGSVAASTVFIQPLLGTLLAIVLLQDQLTSMTIIGGILIIVSIYLISKY